MVQQNAARHPRTLTIIILVIPVLTLSSPQTFERTVLDATRERQTLGEHFYYLQDPQGSWSINNVRSSKLAGLWQPSRTNVPNFGFTGSVYWFAVQVENKTAQPMERILAVTYPMLDWVDLYLVRDGSVSEHLQLGDKVPYANRRIDHRYFLFPIHLSSGEMITLYLRVRTEGSMQVPATLWSEPEFRRIDQYSLLAQGSYFGVMLVMILYNLFIYTAVRDKSYIFYVLFVSCFTISQLILQGFAFQVLWPGLPWLNEKVWLISMNAALVFGGWFATSLLGMKQHNRFLYLAISVLAFIAAVTALAAPFIAYRTAIDITVANSLVICFSCFVAGCLMWKKGYAPARYYTIAWTALLSATVIFVLSKLGIMAHTIITENGMQAGSTIEVILLSFALAARINVARREKELAQAETVSILQKFRKLYENAIEGIFQISLDYTFSNTNRAATQILGIDKENKFLASKAVNLRHCFVDRREADDFFQQMEQKDEIIGYEFRGKRLDGCEFWASLSMRTVYDKRGRPSYYEGSLVDITQRRQAEEQVRVLAYYDHITGLPNRALLHEHVKHALVRAKRNAALVAIFFVDLDRFKLVNDTLGHNVGDRLLREVASRLTVGLRGHDWIARPKASPNLETAEFRKGAVARLGGDEFVMVLGDIRQVEDAAVVAKRVATVLSRPFVLEGRDIYTSASIGISVYPIDGDDATTLIKNADAAMYHVKKQGKNGYQFYAKYINDQASKRLSLETAMRHALKRKEFQLFYQPKVDLYSGRISGAEALCRWRRSAREMIPPCEFIPLAEDSGLIIQLGEWVLRTACEQIAIWQNAGLPPIKISINLSARQFQDPNLVGMIRCLLEQNDLDPACIELEITESILMDDTEATGIQLAQLKSMGLDISIDDFGTGYSSLSYLKRFPVDVLKIDRCFVQDLSKDEDNRAITAAIISMARQLSLRVIAEGVENQEQLNHLQGCGCQEVQGYFVSKPIQGSEFDAFWRRNRVFPFSSTPI